MSAMQKGLEVIVVAKVKTHEIGVCVYKTDSMFDEC
jgi:hypothetical protein